MKKLKELTSEELIEVIKEYSDYVTEYCKANEINPVCFNEFYNNDYKEIPHKGDRVIILKDTIDDDDLLNWLENNNKDCYNISNVEYYSTFGLWIEDCPYIINPDSTIKYN